MNILVSDEGHACLADVGLTRVAGDVNTIATASATTFANTVRWCPPELLDPERYGSKGGDPTKRSDIYSMAMTVYEVSFFRYKPGRSVDVAPRFLRRSSHSTSTMILRRCFRSFKAHDRRNRFSPSPVVTPRSCGI